MNGDQNTPSGVDYVMNVPADFEQKIKLLAKAIYLLTLVVGPLIRSTQQADQLAEIQRILVEGRLIGD